MAAELMTDSVKVPEWAKRVLSSFENRAEPYMEVAIADALRAARTGQGDLKR